MSEQWSNFSIRDPGHSLRRWTARTFTAENVLASIKTLAWVAPLTILIWVYAEREQAVRRPATIPLGVKSLEPGRLVRLRAGEESVSADLVGPNAAVERVQELVRLRGTDDMPAVQIEIDRNIPADGGYHQIDTARAIADNAIFRSRGVTLRECSPRTISVLVDELDERDVEVRPPRDMGNIVAVFEPARVRVRGPKSVLRGDKPLMVEANFGNRDELRSPGTHELSTVALVSSIDDSAISIIPATVRAKIDVNQSDVQFLIESMPIFNVVPSGNPSLLEDYRVEHDPILTRIRVLGPPDKIEQLKKETPRAELVLSREDVGKGKLSRKLNIALPDGVRVAKEDEPKCVISFELRKPPSTE